LKMVVRTERHARPHFFDECEHSRQAAGRGGAQESYFT
jgi:hypothetical protein